MPAYDGTNYPGPWQIRIFYTTPFNLVNYEHVLRCNVDVDTDPGPGSDFADYDLVSRAGLYYDADSWTDALAAAMQTFLNAVCSIDYAELWKYDGISNNAAYQSSMTLGLNGTNGTAVAADSQAIMSFRSVNGGHGFMEVLHSSFSPGQKTGYTGAPSDVQDFMDLVTDLQSPALARDGGYLFSPLNWLPGSSEKLFKDRFR